MADWVIIVDDDRTNLHIASDTLSRCNLRVTALESGPALLDYLRANPAPDLILLDLVMPEMDGFETLKRLREDGTGRESIPVIFLSGEDGSGPESKSLQLGAADFIRKPFDPDTLISRVQNALRTQEKLHQFEHDAITDQMTGFLNKTTIESRMAQICRLETGFLCILDLDSFKLINDLYGHDTGDQVIILFANLLRNNMRSEDICGRIGGDEFILFARNMQTEEELRHFVERINKEYLRLSEEILGVPLKLPLGISVGAVRVPDSGQDYGKLFRLADHALHEVKLNGKHGCALYGSGVSNVLKPAGHLNLEDVTLILEERNISSNAMWMGREAFINIYRYMMRYMERYHGVAYRALLTITPVPASLPAEEKARVLADFRSLIQSSLRNSDVMVEVSENQIFLLLPETRDAGIGVVMDRLMGKWSRFPAHDKISISWETGRVHLSPKETPQGEESTASWVAVAEEDPAALRLAEQVLTSHGVRVAALSSGPALLDFLRDNRPDLILLSASLAEPDGLETLRRLRQRAAGLPEIPVVLTLADDSAQIVSDALALGAEEVLRKPFVPDLLLLRVSRVLELHRLRWKAAQTLSPASPLS